MASLYDTSATKALNEDAYINKLYDGTLDSQKKALQQGYDNSVKQLTTGQQNTQKQTSDYVKRAYVEGKRSSGHLQKSTPSISTPGLGNGGAGAQARLTIGNQQQKNVSALNNQQAVAEQEYERQRKLLAEKYEAQIKQAQADNDMVRAQALYDAAKAEEEQLRSLRESAASLMAGKGDMSISNAIAQGAAVTPDTTSPTWDGVLKNEEDINKIYDAKLESQKQEAEIAHKESMSELDAQQEAAVRKTDKNLTNAYVDALKKNKNYQEVQNAYGQGSGASIRARLARETGLTEKLTDLRKLQLGKDAETELKKADLTHALGETISKAQGDIDKERNQELYDAAEDEEQALIEEQKTVGNLLAKQNNYSVLGKLYGLSQDQIHRLQGTGAYAPVYYGGGGGYSGGGGGGGGDGGTAGTTYDTNRVLEIQKMLNAQGKNLAENGVFDNATREAYAHYVQDSMRENYAVTNSHNDEKIKIEGATGGKGITYEELGNLILEDKVKEVVDPARKTITYVSVEEPKKKNSGGAVGSNKTNMMAIK
ncbi:MAG: hypothetical protein IKT52_13525 [Oscillospiraceae bacterium]|nr:hypothetical protein [Oscillospiraceae bacterium]